MFSILLDELPTQWNGYDIDGDFQIGIQISQCMNDESLNPTERMMVAAGLLFGDSCPNKFEEITEALNWFLNGWNHDNTKASGKGASSKKKSVETMDFDVDQWRIYAAFKSQYGIDLNVNKLHWFSFMGLLSNLEECAFTRVIGIRQQKITGKMSADERRALKEAKLIYSIRNDSETTLSVEEQKKVEEFMKYANIKPKG